MHQGSLLVFFPGTGVYSWKLDILKQGRSGQHQLLVHWTKLVYDKCGKHPERVRQTNCQSEALF